MTDNFAVAADELRQFVERFEQLEAEKQDVAALQKELTGELKGRGYAVKAFKRIIALRKIRPDDLAEQEAVEEMYRNALGMK